MSNVKSNKGNIRYQGKVTVQTYKGKQLLSTYQQHNEGLLPLFGGLCKLFAGTYKIDQVKPMYIAAYTLTQDSVSPTESWPNLITKDQNSPIAKIKMASAYMPLESSHVDYDAATITYKTKIPYSYITEENIYALALLPASFNQVDPEQSALACFRLADNTAWRPVYCPKTESENILLVEWQLNFSDGGDA